MYHQPIIAGSNPAEAEAPARPASPLIGLLIALPLGLAFWGGLFELVYLLG